MVRWALVLALPIVAVAVEAVPTPAVAVAPLDAGHTEFVAVLAAVVRADGVDYGALRRDHAALDRYRAQLAAAAIPSQREAKLAHFINAYNALTLALVVERLPADAASWPTWSINQLGSAGSSAWKSYDFVLGGSRMTLDEIEHQHLRPLGEPRIHLAINCASRSCPPLAAQPFLAATLDAQLTAVSRAFAARPSDLRLADGVLHLNPILEWFGGDFAAVGGVRAFLRAHVPPGPVAEHLASERPLAFFAYDWSLNLAGAP